MSDNARLVHERLEQRLVRGRFEVPMLPEAAACALRLCADSCHVTAHRAFTLALQDWVLHLPGHKSHLERLWRHALGSALWARELAQCVAYDPDMCHLCGLLHCVGEPVTLSAVTQIASEAQLTLVPQEYAQLLETFHRPIGQLVAEAWSLPHSVRGVMTHWENYDAAGDLRIECNIVALAHRLADRTLDASSQFAHACLATESSFVHLGLEPHDASVIAAALPSVNAEISGYFPVKS